jgi:hypothetical protein
MQFSVRIPKNEESEALNRPQREGIKEEEKNE